MRSSLSVTLFLFFFFLVDTLTAQIKADFGLSKNAGCSPLVVSFTSTTWGASTNATYEWNFGNGNTSKLEEPKAVFTEPGTYNVTLTIRDGGQSSTQSKQVIVYKNPEVSFRSSKTVGCLPLPVDFLADANPGDSLKNTYTWDFGDGNTVTTSSGNVSHTYLSEQKATVSLTISNGYGCNSTVERRDLLEVKAPLKPDFKADDNIICKEGDPVQLLNLTTGIGQLNYLWDFGDGKISTEKDPVHIFNRSGVFSLKLTVNNSEGCTATVTKPNMLNVANFKSDFAIPQPVCRGKFEHFKNQSSPGADSFTWFVDGEQIYGLYVNELYYRFQNNGLHKIRLEQKFGKCFSSVEKEFEVKSVTFEGFTAELKDRCKYPTEYILKDTSKAGVAWEWLTDVWTSKGSPDAIIPIYENGDEVITLYVKDTLGCVSQLYKTVRVNRPTAVVIPSQSAFCGAGEVKFKVETSEKIIDYNWNFGTAASKIPEPVFFYDKPGKYKPSVTMKTEDGCEFTISTDIIVREPIKASFSVPDQTICGNTIVKFTPNVIVPDGMNQENILLIYSFGDGNGIVKGWHVPVEHRYQDSGRYLVSMVATDGVCSTYNKIDLHVLPPISKIHQTKTSCEGSRGTAWIDYETKHAASGFWDFGDGTFAPLDSSQRQISHEYSKSGQYKIMLSVTNGSCTVKDSITSDILRKQSPILAASKAELCLQGETINMTVSNLDTIFTGYQPRYISKGFKDRNEKDVLMVGNYWEFNDRSYNFKVSDFLEPIDKQEIRLFLTTNVFNCIDTSNWIPLKILGPAAAFKANINPCKLPIIVNFTDLSSEREGSMIVKREWNFDDGSRLVTNDLNVQHGFNFSNNYFVSLRVTDQRGCATGKVSIMGIHFEGFAASFVPSASLISPGSQVRFNNTSRTNDPLNTVYNWWFGDGSTSNEKDPVKQYTQPGVYQVKLVANNPVNNCTDTAIATITVKFINAAFRFNTDFVTSSKCPPVKVQFTNTSANVSRIYWDFGDGTTSTVFNPSHIYTKAGIYVVTVKSYSDNGTEYRTTDTVKVLQPLAQLTADSLTGCTNQRTVFKASAQNALNYTWDFGDGTVIASSDSIARYNYMNSGVFRPKLIVIDANGCNVGASLKDSVVIDSLSLRLNGLPSQICVPRAVEFNSTVATAVAGQQLDYRWKFGTANGDSSDLEKPTFNYSLTGKFQVQLTVRTSFGCVRTVSHEIIANQGLGAVINGPAEVCEGSDASFIASTQIQGNPKWTWLFPDGSTSTLQNPAALKLLRAGDYQVKLIADNSGCTDTLIKNIKVNAKPTAIITDRTLQICNGSSIELRAQGGVGYKWAPVKGLTKDTGSTVVASPQQTVFYAVNVTNEKGCDAKDSVQVKVVQKQKLNLAPELSICAGTSAKLSANGTDKYNWIGNTSGLSSSSIAEPTASPSSSTTYQVVGSDAAGCFSDTASVNVIVNASPTVDAGVGAEISVGASYQLSPTASADVTKYLWSPDRNLSCVTCLSPVASPTESVTYTLQVSNAKGCVATDTVTVEVMCTESKIYIPNVFTPNGDGKNDLFSIKGAGIKVVKSFRIFDRWGKMIFEKTNFQINDPSASWNGRVNGVNVPVGSYIYMAELTCDGNTFTRKGTVSVIY